MKFKAMKLGIGIICCFITFSLFSNTIQKTYAALNSKEESEITNQIQWLKKNETSSMKTAYIAALTMKQASFQWTPWSKWSYFTTGRDMLEKEIKKNSANVEMRFLRLMIQENAPSIVGYSAQIGEDAKLIKAEINKQSTELQSVIRAYAKQSSALASLQKK